MSKTKKIIIFGLIASVLALSAIFGILGLCSLSAKFRDSLLAFLEFLGWIPPLD